jgi:phosphoenolpyruvate carboxykinase (ATP)
MKLSHTRAMLRAALQGELERVPFAADPIFGLQVPQSCPGVPDPLLSPRGAWPDPAEYDSRARRLAALFQQNFMPFAAQATEAVRQAGPRS